MGNTAGFGDTRLPTDAEDHEIQDIYNRGFPSDENFDPSQITYRNGVNYRKDGSTIKRNYQTETIIGSDFETSVPAGILKKYLRPSEP